MHYDDDDVHESRRGGAGFAILLSMALIFGGVLMLVAMPQQSPDECRGITQDCR